MKLGRALSLILFGMMLGITVMPAGQTQPVSFVVSVGQGGNIATVTAGGSLKVDSSTAPNAAVNQGNAGTAAQSWFTRLVDSGGVNTETVKAASTAPVAADPAAVVSISPNSAVYSSTAATQLPITQIQATTGNSTTTSAANTALTVTLAATAGQRWTIRHVNVFVSAAATCTFTIADGATTIFSVPVNAATASATNPGYTFLPSVTGATGNAMTLSVGACGAGVTSTVNVVSDRQ